MLTPLNDVPIATEISATCGAEPISSGDVQTLRIGFVKNTCPYHQMANSSHYISIYEDKK